MKISVLAVILSIIYAAPPVPRKTPDSPASASGKAQSDTKRENTPVANLPAVVDGNASQADNPHGNGKGGHDTEHSITISKLPSVTVDTPKRDWADWGTWFFNFLLVVVGGLQAWLLRRTYTTMKSQLNEMQTQANTMKGQLGTTINAERAWVMVELRKDAEYDYAIEVTNMGRTPAHIISYELRYTCLVEGITDVSEYDGDLVGRTEVNRFIAAGGNAKIGEPFHIMEYMWDDLREINSSAKTAVFHGWVHYRHMFSTELECYADFCYSFKASEQRLISISRHTRQRQEKEQKQAAQAN